MLRAFLTSYFFRQCEKPEVIFYKALRIVLTNPGLRVLELIFNSPLFVEQQCNQQLAEQ